MINQYSRYFASTHPGLKQGNNYEVIWTGQAGATGILPSLAVRATGLNNNPAGYDANDFSIQTALVNSGAILGIALVPRQQVQPGDMYQFSEQSPFSSTFSETTYPVKTIYDVLTVGICPVRVVTPVTPGGLALVITTGADQGKFADSNANATAITNGTVRFLSPLFTVGGINLAMASVNLTY